MCCFNHCFSYAYIEEFNVVDGLVL
jgi:hypothetical protein